MKYIVPILLVLGVCIYSVVTVKDSENYLYQCLCEFFTEGAVKPPTGVVDDCCCDVATVEQYNAKIRPILDKLVNTTFFRYYKVNLWRDCTYFPNDGQCAMPSCAVDECDPIQFEKECGPWTDTSDTTPHLSKLDMFVSEKATASLDEGTWTCTLDEAMQSANKAEELSIVDLVANPERYTGYKGEAANRIWRAIYDENCFADGPLDVQSTCKEKRMVFRLVSGLHTSVSTHLSYKYLLDEKSDTWGPNVPLWRRMVANDPDRIKNLYFVYMLTLRAMTKLMPVLSSYNYNIKQNQENIKIKNLMNKLQKVVFACPQTFDESGLFKGKGGQELKQQFKSTFLNISSILDCIGCEKCKLWGKLQINGLGTAIRGVFETEEQGHVDLRRTEIVALVNVFNQLSHSLEATKHMIELERYQMVQWGSMQTLKLVGIFFLSPTFILVLYAICNFCCGRK